MHSTVLHTLHSNSKKLSTHTHKRTHYSNTYIVLHVFNVLKFKLAPCLKVIISFFLSTSLSLSLFCIVPLTRHLMHIPDMSINFYCLQAGLHRTSDDKNTRWFLNEFAFVIRQKVSSTHTERQRHNGCKKRPVNEHVMYFRKAAFKFPNFCILNWCTELMW